MKKIFLFTTMVLLLTTLTFCGKEGPVGPEGPAGPQGPAGTDGKDGTSGVITYLFTDSATIAWDPDDEIFLPYGGSFIIPDSIREEGMVLVYTKIRWSGTWYPVPGLGQGASYTTRLFVSANGLTLAAHDPDGGAYTGSTPLPELSAVKVMLIPPATVINLKKGGIPVDLADYGAVAEYFRVE